VTLILIAIADICRSEVQNHEMIGYVDDWYLYTCQKQIKNAEPIIHRALDNIERWTQRTGFNISTEKTNTIVFPRSRPRNGRPAFKITLLRQTVEEVKALKILGLTFDSRLTWQTHVRRADQSKKTAQHPEMFCLD
jgi:hypothetical protein